MNNKVLPRWSRLDNAAKIFPSNSSMRDSKVFRFVCELKDFINPVILQTALDRAVEQFPFFQSVMKRGAFWYYLEESDIKPVVQKEYELPCIPLYDTNKESLLFRVLYYNKRVSVEIYHTLTDGTGALQFFRTLIYYYLLERHCEEFASVPSLDYDASWFQKRDDSFQKYYEKPNGTKISKRKKAYCLNKEHLPDRHLSIIEGKMSLKSLLECSRSMGITITELLTSLFIMAIHQEMNLREQKEPVVITIPVNLRNYFPSESARNFFTVINAGYNFSYQEDSLEAVASCIRQVFKEELKEEKLKEQMNVWSALEHNILIRLLPLFVKDAILRTAAFIMRRKTTASFSNVGRVSMPKEMEKYINLFTAYTSPDILQACSCSFGDNYVISFASPFYSRDVERTFFRFLTQMGIEVEIAANKIETGK